MTHEKEYSNENIEQRCYTMKILKRDVILWKYYREMSYFGNIIERCHTMEIL